VSEYSFERYLRLLGNYVHGTRFVEKQMAEMSSLNFSLTILQHLFPSLFVDLVIEKAHETIVIEKSFLSDPLETLFGNQEQISYFEETVNRIIQEYVLSQYPDLYVSATSGTKFGSLRYGSIVFHSRFSSSTHTPCYVNFSNDLRVAELQYFLKVTICERSYNLVIVKLREESTLKYSLVDGSSINLVLLSFVVSF